MILKEKHIDDRQINQRVGEPVRVDWTKPKTIGGPGLFLKKFVNKTGRFEKIQLDSKCNFEKRTDGLLIHTNFSNKRALVPIASPDILELKIVRGKERINPLFPYPMWFLLKLGVSILYARYFRFRAWEYAIEPMEFKLSTKEYDFEFIGNGFDFERKQDFLKKLDLGDLLKTEIVRN
ncbi:MAG: hypothetical protein AAFO99_02530 [Bacteroidota bacterium]